MDLLKKNTSPKTIGVVLGTFEEACQIKILAGITNYLKHHHINLNLFVGATLEGYASYNGSYTVLADLISSTNLDGLLLMGGAISSLLSPKALTHFVAQFTHLPILSISSPIAGIPSLLVDNYSGISDIVSHLIQAHGCQTIAFIGGPSDHDEATIRLEAYKATLSENHLIIDPELIIDGDFSRQAGEDAIRTLLDDKGFTHIDAFVCVDDTTAYGVLHALKLRGYSIPNDFYVTGFDDIEEAKSSIPQLTTVRQPFYEMGECGVRMLLDYMKGIAIPMYTYYPAQMIIRESCGCFSRMASVARGSLSSPTLPLQFETLDANITHFIEGVSTDFEHTTLSLDHIHKTLNHLIYQMISIEDVDDVAFWCALRNIIYSYLDHRISLDFWEKLFSFSYEAYTTYSSEKDNLYLVKYFFTRLHSLLREIKLCHEQYLHTEQYLHNFSLRSISQKLIASFDLSSLFSIIEEGLINLGIRECYIIVSHDVLPRNYTTKETSDQMVLIFSYVDGKRLPHKEGIAFSYEKLAPSATGQVGSYLFMPLLFRNEHLGYIAFTYDVSITPNVFETLRSHISSGIKGAFLYQEQQHIQQTLHLTLEQLENVNSELHNLSVKDELTGLFNRRGFMTVGSEIFNKSVLHQHALVLFYLDLDGLKIINDTYGHSEGDHALIHLSQILRHTFRECDILARLGGDEFTLLTPNLPSSAVPEVINRLEQALITFNENTTSPYQLSTSIGYAIYSSQMHRSLEDMMSVADKHLYKQKKLKGNT